MLYNIIKNGLKGNSDTGTTVTPPSASYVMAAFLGTYLLSFFQYIFMALGLSIPFWYDYVTFSFSFPSQGLFNCIVYLQSNKGKLQTREAQWMERIMCYFCRRIPRYNASSSDSAEQAAPTPVLALSPEKVVSVQSSLRGVSSKMESIKEEEPIIGAGEP